LRRRKRTPHPGRWILLILCFVLLCAGLAGGTAVSWVYRTAASAPPLSSLKQKNPGALSEVFAADGKTRLGFIQNDDLVTPVASNDFPKVLQNATVAIEDQRFYKHKGVDYEGIVRAAIKNAKSHKTVQGGSTLTMQLVRNLYTGDTTRSGVDGYKRKIREARLAQELEQIHPKSWVLGKYLNTVPYGTVGGQTAVGAGAAARLYFDKRVQDLTLREAAMLAGMPQAPSDYSPVLNPQGTKARRNEVLGKMAELGMISKQTAASVSKKNLGLHMKHYFAKKRESYVLDYVKTELFKEYGKATVQRGGFKVYTTINLKYQQWARKAMEDKLAGVGPSSAIVTIDPRNGNILAMASSQKYGQSKFNLAAQGHRQPGSSFKVMALMTALREGVNPDSTHYTSVSPMQIRNPPCGSPAYPWDVKTYGGRGAGTLSLHQATLLSDNSVYAQLTSDLGPDKVRETARMMGIRSKLLGVCAETLGGLTDGVSPLEMANAYATIASGGYRNRLTAITKVTFPDGHSELPDRWKVRRVKAFEDGVTYKATQILEENMLKGTATKAQIGCPAAAKTGTTDNFTDAWLVGFTPRLATAVWVGYPNERVEMSTLYFGGPVAGGTFPAQIWGAYMKQAKGKYCGEFQPPKVPFQAQPFFGKYARGGAKEKPDHGLVPVTPAGPTATPESTKTPEAGRGGDGLPGNNG